MEDQETVDICMMAAATVACIEIQEEKKKRKRKVWVKPFLAKRESLGWHKTLVPELANDDPDEYAKFMRMNVVSFNYLLDKIRSSIERSDTVMRAAVPAEARLAVTLHYLATGATFTALAYGFRISRSLIGRIIPETCEAIYQSLKEDNLKMPSSAEEWRRVANDFETKWNFPGCIGALDGKHVHMRKPANSGSTFINYKQTFSIVLMALVDANYRILYADVGCQGRISDGGVFSACTLSRALANGSLGIPNPEPLPGTSEPRVPYTIVGDAAFPLWPNLMKPYPEAGLCDEKRVFNYRLSRARRVVENAFGIMSSKFRVLLTNVLLTPEDTQKVVLACCALHNFLLDKPTPSLRVSRTMRSVESPDMNDLRGGKCVRDTYCHYFNGIGSVAWQRDRI